jgi:hypothetical protein
MGGAYHICLLDFDGELLALEGLDDDFHFKF